MSFGGKVNSAVDTTIDGEGWPDLSTGEFRSLRRAQYPREIRKLGRGWRKASF